MTASLPMTASLCLQIAVSPKWIRTNLTSNKNNLKTKNIFKTRIPFYMLGIINSNHERIYRLFLQNTLNVRPFPNMQSNLLSAIVWYMPFDAVIQIIWNKQALEMFTIWCSKTCEPLQHLQKRHKFTQQKALLYSPCQESKRTASARSVPACLSQLCKNRQAKLLGFCSILLAAWKPLVFPVFSRDHFREGNSVVYLPAYPELRRFFCNMV